MIRLTIDFLDTREIYAQSIILDQAPSPSLCPLPPRIPQQIHPPFTNTSSHTAQPPHLGIDFPHNTRQIFPPHARDKKLTPIRIPYLHQGRPITRQRRFGNSNNITANLFAPIVCRRYDLTEQCFCFGGHVAVEEEEYVCGHVFTVEEADGSREGVRAGREGVFVWCVC